MLATKCPECGQENEEGSTVCVTCDSSLNTDDYKEEIPMDDGYDDEDDWDEDEEDEDE